MSNRPITLDELKRICPKASKSTLLRNLELSVPAGGLEKDAERKQDPGSKPMGPPSREGVDKVRRLVRITSYRMELVDERNLFDKYFTDALVEAGILFDDAPRWAKVEVEQVKVYLREHERTEIEVFPTDRPTS